MATVREIVKGAYSRLGQLALGSDLDPDRAAQGLECFNDFVNSLQLDGIFPGGPNAPQARYNATIQNSFPPHGPNNSITPIPDNPVEDALNDTFPFPSMFTGGFKFMLAAYMADVSGTMPSQLVMRMAASAKTDLLAYYIVAPMSSMDPALTHFPSQRNRRGSGGDIISGDTQGSVIQDGDEVIIIID